MAFRQLVLFSLFLHCRLSDRMKISIVSVQEGQSVIIPCLYEKEHEDDTKLWCRKDDLSKCAAGVSISDDITYGIFTVHMTNTRREDAGDYCCTVKPKTNSPQMKDCTKITISEGGPALSVLNPMISGYESGTASVLFQHRFPPGSKRQFCQQGGECVGWDFDSGSLNGMAVMLSDVTDGEFIVTLSGLQRKNTGWYVCTMGGYQTPVHLNVTGIRPTQESPETTTDTNMATPSTDQRGIVEVLVPVGVGVSVLIVLCAATVGLVRWRRGKRKAPHQAAANTDSACETMYSHDQRKKRSPKQAVSSNQSAELDGVHVKDTHRKRPPKHVLSSDQSGELETIHLHDKRKRRSPENTVPCDQSADLLHTHVKDTHRKRSPKPAVSSDQSAGLDATHVKDTHKKRSPRHAVSSDQSAGLDATHVKDTHRKRSPRHAVSSDQSAGLDATHVKDTHKKRSPRHAVSSHQSADPDATHVKDTRRKRSPKDTVSSYQLNDLYVTHVKDTRKQRSPEHAVSYDQSADLDAIYGNV
ncbi:uncharacterized protein LOC134088253 isoform X2 [Sardina pilchardus]|uniref:uncharacterized protein LOC134088253 isoform X2 n=1 Tax=Sardina pilchardus TaxID=27697 RepID=UPI002E0EB55C